MLTRLRVTGFKNLYDVDVRFGPFTCVAGANAVGKSNLFDAIRFLSALADRPFLEAALGVRGEEGRLADIRHLFFRPTPHETPRMAFEAEMLVPPEGTDDLGQPARASITFLRYRLELAYRREEPGRPHGGFELLREELTQINKGEAGSHLLFPHSRAWRETAVTGPGRRSPFISTDGEGRDRVVHRHQEGTGSRIQALRAADLPRTVLSETRALESPTALLARREMQSWRRLQLEPSALRRPDSFTAPQRVSPEGAHLAATLYRLAHTGGPRGNGGPVDPERTYARIANLVADLVPDVRQVDVERDERRELLTLRVTGADGEPHPARSLSDGTLRFLALAVLGLDPGADRLLCLEEPENGVHPARIPALIHLLREIAADAVEPVDTGSPLRQVIVNTHSPVVVANVPEEALLIAVPREVLVDGKPAQQVSFECLESSWRTHAKDGCPTVARAHLQAYLNPLVVPLPGHSGRARTVPPRRVMDHPALQPLLPLVGSDE